MDKVLRNKKRMEMKSDRGKFGAATVRITVNYSAYLPGYVHRLGFAL
jgi:hypothetical protein